MDTPIAGLQLLSSSLRRGRSYGQGGSSVSRGVSLITDDACAASSLPIKMALSAGNGRWAVETLSASKVSQGGSRLQYVKRLNQLKSSIWGQKLVISLQTTRDGRGMGRGIRTLQLRANQGELAMKNASKLNLDQYMVTLDHPIGIRFGQTLSGKIYVDALEKNGNAIRDNMIMVGDVLKKTNAGGGNDMFPVEDLAHTIKAIKARSGPVSLTFERSSPLFRSSIRASSEAPFNVGRVAVSTWNNNNFVGPYQPSSKQEGGNVGFATYSSKFFVAKALESLSTLSGRRRVGKFASTILSYEDEETFEVTGFYSDEETGDPQWTHGNYNEAEYLSAVERTEGDLCYNPALGMNYSKITEQIYVGSCIQEESDVLRLKDKLGITAILNLQRKTEQDNWGIDGEAIEKLAKKEDLMVVNCPIRDVDSVDVRRKLPFAVGVLYRLLRQGHRVYVSCTTGLDRSPACVIAYLHWIQDVSLQEAVDYIKMIHPCGPDRAALVWATWDLIAMVEEGEHKGPPTHSVQFVWNHGCRDGEEVLLVGEFKGGWNEPIKAVHISGPKYTVDLRLPQGKYYYKFIVGGHWRHSSSLPTEGDQGGNINNVIRVGDVATTNFDIPHRPKMKDLNSIKVIERPLTEDERFTLAFAARRMAYAIDPFTFTAKLK